MNPIDSIEGAIAVSGNRKNVLVVQLSTYKESKLFGIRRWYVDGKTGEWKPTRKGVSLGAKGFGLLKAVVKDKGLQIEEWLNSGGFNGFDVPRGTVDLAKVINNYSLSVCCDTWSSPEVAKVDVKGSCHVLTINLHNRQGKAIYLLLEEYFEKTPTALETKLIEALVCMLAAQGRTSLMFERNEKWVAGELLDADRWNFGIALEHFLATKDIDYVI